MGICCGVLDLLCFAQDELPLTVQVLSSGATVDKTFAGFLKLPNGAHTEDKEREGGRQRVGAKILLGRETRRQNLRQRERENKKQLLPCFGCVVEEGPAVPRSRGAVR